MSSSRREETDTYIRGVCFAPILLVLGLIVLILNEGHVRTQHKTFRNTIQSVTNVQADSPVSTQNEGKLIHLYGWAKVSSSTSSTSSTASSGSVVQDPLFGVSNSNSKSKSNTDGSNTNTNNSIIKLKRSVEMYQWDEEAITSDTFEYTKAWEDELIDSSEFEEPQTYSNPTFFPFDSNVVSYNADQTKLGNYILSADILDQMNWFQDYDGTLSIDTVTDESTKNSLRIYTSDTNNNKQYFTTGDPNSPTVGDARVSFQEIPEQVISVVAMQSSNGSLVPFETTTSTASGNNSILLVQPGWHSAKQMMKQAHADATSWKGWLRILAFLLILGGFKIIVEPMSVIADIVEDQFPVFADLVYSASNGAVAYFSGFTFMTVMALSWITYAPFTSLFQLGLVAFSTQIARRLIRSDRVPKAVTRVTSGFDQLYEMLPMENVV
mmetsp:Transcript_32587/g.79067  ORF Transcript_32587/g.79067 Transcript_32587/m.79067 type:complete len:438 (+) Transcript_32587:112-1425(+)